MAIGFGAGSNMTRDVERNRKQQVKSRGLKDVVETHGTTKRELNIKKASEEDLAEWKMNHAIKQEQHKKKVLIVLIITALIIGGFIIFISGVVNSWLFN